MKKAIIHIAFYRVNKNGSTTLYGVAFSKSNFNAVLDEIKAKGAAGAKIITTYSNAAQCVSEYKF